MIYESKIENKIHDLLLQYSGQDLTDKAGNHAFEYFYPRVLEKYLSKDNFSLLEIGVSWGYSLEMWAKIFPKGQIYGVDRDHKRIKAAKKIISGGIDTFEWSQPNITILPPGEQGNPETYNFLRENNIKLDVIIDDGSHLKPDQEATWYTIKDLLKTDGVYIIEDVPPDLLNKYKKDFIDSFEVINLTHIKKRHDDILLLHRTK